MHEGAITHTAKLWRWGDPGAGSWHFLTIDGAAGQSLSETALLRRLELGKRRGFGSLRVDATIGETRWRTSVFPKRDDKGWDLPVKAAVRAAEAIGAGDAVTVTLLPL